MEFKPFPKLARLNREIVVTEKIDGSNAQIYIASQLELPSPNYIAKSPEGLVMFAGSRTRWITPQDDNFGFAKWVEANAEELWGLGPGQHFGEFWGGKIQRGYGLKEKRFSLFNTSRWADRHLGYTPDTLVYIGDGRVGGIPVEGQQWAPSCCRVVPVLWQGPFSQQHIDHTLFMLRHNGSAAAPGFMKPEGIVIYHTAANMQFKVTLEGDEVPKSLQEVA